MKSYANPVSLANDEILVKLSWQLEREWLYEIYKGGNNDTPAVLVQGSYNCVVSHL